MSSKQIYSDQVVAALVQEGISQSEIEMQQRLSEIQQIALEKTQYARTALSESLDCIENARDFISDPNRILGNMQTKHGEIAEHIEVEIRNGRDILKQIKPSATFEGVGRTAPEDYIINNELVQSKFINGANKSLDHVLEHMRKYPDFTDKGYYHIPKDQFELISKISKGQSIDGIHSRTIIKCNEIIKTIENESGKSFSDVVKPSISKYDDVQLSRVDYKLSEYENEFHDTHREDVESIREEKSINEVKAQQITAPSWGEAFKYSAVAAVISGSTSAGIKIYCKVHNGTKITEFSLSDWKEVGYDFAKGGGKGAISGLGIYGLTKVSGFSAPFAGAMVSSAMGISSLLVDYNNGNISQQDFSDSVLALSTESALAAIGAAVGQTLIPIPALGAIIGSAVSKSALEITKYLVGKNESSLIAKMESDYLNLTAELDQEVQIFISQIDSYFTKMDGYINAALDKDIATRFAGSIQLCQLLEVPDNQILKSIEEVNSYMLQ